MKNPCDKPTEIKSQAYSIEQEVPRMMIDATHQMQSNYSIESTKGTVTKVLQLVAENEIEKGFSTKKRFVKGTRIESRNGSTLKKNNTVLIFCPWQFQKTYFNLSSNIYLSQKKCL